MEKEAAVQANNLTFAYRPNQNIINGLSLSLFEGETAALVGPNGAGKTTLGKLLSGILKPAAGNNYIFGEDSRNMPLHRIAEKIGYNFQNPEHQLLAVSVEEEIAFGLKFRGINPELILQTTDRLLKLFEIEHLRQAFPMNLSWGEKKRLVLAASLALEPKYLILDEPTVGLDRKRIDILNLILKNLRQKGIGMLLISHNQSFVEDNASRILVMERGRIVHDYCS